MAKHAVAKAGNHVREGRLVDSGCAPDLLHHLGRPADVLAPQVKTVERRQRVGLERQQLLELHIFDAQVVE